MSELSDFLGVPEEVKRDGVTWLISPMVLEDWAALDAWAEKRFWIDIEARLKKISPDDKAGREKLQAFYSANRREISREVAAYMDDADAWIFRLWRMLLHKQPSVTLEMAGRLMRDTQFFQICRKLMGRKETGFQPNRKIKDECIFRLLGKHYSGFTPDVVKQLTNRQINAYLAGIILEEGEKVEYEDDDDEIDDEVAKIGLKVPEKK